jgi:hypothetical protein
LMLLSIIDGSFQELWVPLHNFFGFQLQQHRQSLLRVLYFSLFRLPTCLS